MTEVASTIAVRSVAPEDREFVTGLIRDEWGSDVAIAHGEVFRPAELPGFIALAGGRAAGLVTYVIDEDECEIVSINSLVKGRGIGTALVDEVARVARQAGCLRVHLVTTNDNLDALRFYQRRGFRLAALRPGAIDEARRIKPEIGQIREHGIPIRDELELELLLS